MCRVSLHPIVCFLDQIRKHGQPQKLSVRKELPELLHTVGFHTKVLCASRDRKVGFPPRLFPLSCSFLLWRRCEIDADTLTLCDDRHETGAHTPGSCLRLDIVPIN